MKENKIIIRLLGEPKILSPDGTLAHLPTAKTVAALSMIASSGSAGTSRQSIGEALWSRSGEQQARTNLRQALSAVRKALGPMSDSLKQRGDLLWLDRTNTWVDIDLISENPQPIADTDLEILLSSGEFLQGINLNESGFEEWLKTESATLIHRLQECLAKSCEDKLNRGAFFEAEKISRKLIAVDNFNESAHRARMRALAGCGEAATAVRHFIEFQALLKSELGVSPGVETIELAESLKADAQSVETPPSQKADPAPVRPAATVDAQVEPRSPQPKPSPELRNVLVVSAEIVADDEKMQNAQVHFQSLADLSSQITALLGDFGGTELSNTGASLLAVFGFPLAHSKDGERALFFSQQVQSLIREAMPKSLSRISIVSGIVLASSGNVTNVLGDPVRRAQSQLYRTPDDRITVDRGVFRATSGLAAYAALSDDLWAVAVSSDDAAPTKATAFVGRDRELRQALELLEDVQEDERGEVIVLRGEAGIGKTRLSAEICTQARDLGYDVRQCRILDFGQGQKDNSLAMIAATLSDGQPDGLNRMEASVWQDMVTPKTLSEASARLVRELDEKSLLEEQLRVLDLLAEQQTTQAPLLLLVEDVHWADPNLLYALSHLTAHAGGLSMVMLLTTRPENDPIDATWRLRAGNTKTTTLDLQALRRKAALQLARNMRDLDEALVNLCLDRANGNPLFIEQLILWAEEQSETNLPLSVQSVVQERLDKLPQATRQLAQAASVLGQVFSGDALAAVYGGDTAGTDALGAAHLFVSRGADFSFVHALVRDGIYASISPQDRQQLHQRAARHFDTTDRVLAARHHYWSEAEGACRICYEVAQEEHGAGRLEHAHELANLALESCDQPEMRPRFHLLLGEILRDRERFVDATRAFQTVETDDEALKLRALAGQAESQYRLDNQDECERLVDLAEAVSLAATNAAWKTTLACLRSGIAFTRAHSQQAISSANAAMVAAEGITDKRLRARAISTLADAEMVGGLFHSSEKHFRECVSLCRDTGQQRYGLSNQSLVAMLRFYDADVEGAYKLMTEVVTTARSVNFARAQMNGEHMLAYIEAARGKYDLAYDHWQRARKIIEDSGAKRFIMNSGCYAAMVMGPVGRVEEAMTYLDEAERTAEELDLIWVLPWVLASRARWTDDYEVATKALDQAQDYVFSGRVTYPFEFYYVGIDAALKHKDWTRAETYCEKMQAYYAQEPIGMVDFTAAKARALMAVGQSHEDDGGLQDVIDTANAKELIEARDALLHGQIR